MFLRFSMDQVEQDISQRSKHYFQPTKFQLKLAFQINNRGGWDELLQCFEIDEATLNAALGVKHVYMRHLESYEKVHYQVIYLTK